MPSTLIDSSTPPSKLSQFTLQLLLLLTALAAVSIFAYTRHIRALDLANEVTTLRNLLPRNLITLEQELDKRRSVRGERHALTLKLSKQIEEIEAKLNPDSSE